MRSSRLAGLYTLLFASLAVVACGDSEERSPNTAGTSSQAGSNTGGTTSGSGGAAGGSTSKAGTGFGEGGTAVAGSAGTAGAGGTAGTPGCATVCNDSNACTDDACEAGVCVYTNNTIVCDDGNECTSDDACTGGACEGTNNTIVCDDGNECTSDDACAAGMCQGTNNTIVCDDLTSCTTADACAAGVCTGTRDTVLCPACDDGLNLIQNCDFTDGLNHWPQGFFGGAGTQVVSDERLVVDITAGGANSYEVQPRQEPLALKQGMKYKLRLVAGASVARSFVVSLTQAIAPYAIYSPGDTGGGFTVTVTEQMKPFEFEFTMTEPDYANVKLELKLGGQAGNPSVVYIDDVYLVEVRCDGTEDCGDAEECTTDVCDIATGICSWTNSTAACTTDDNECTNDVCLNGECTHGPLPDNDPCTPDSSECTADVCTGGVCTHPPLPNDDPCTADADACTADVCKTGVCTHDIDPTACP